EQACAGAVLVVLGRLALAVQTTLAHPALPTADVEGDDDPVAHLEPGDGRAHVLHDAHGLVPDDVAGSHERGQGVVQVQVGPAQAGGGHAYDRVGGVLDPGVRDVGDLHV